MTLGQPDENGQCDKPEKPRRECPLTDEVLKAMIAKLAEEMADECEKKEEPQEPS